MRRSPLHLGLVALVAGAVYVTAQPDAEAACEAEREAFSEAYVAGRMAGTAERRALLRRLAPLIEQYETSAPICGGRLRGHEAFLQVMAADYGAVVETVGAYLAGPGRRTAVESRIALYQQLGYALDRLQRPVASIEAYYQGAALADQATALVGARALILAAAGARGLGDFRSSDAYLDAALALVDDSLASDPGLGAIKGHALVSRSFLTDDRLSLAVDAAERRRLVARLEAASGEAAALLPAEGQWAGLKALALNFYALAAAYGGRFQKATARLAPSFGLARAAGDLLPTALYDAQFTEGRIRLLSGDVAGAEAAFQKALAEAQRLAQPRDQVGAHEALGRIAEQTGDRDAARAHFSDAVDLVEAQRAGLGLGDWSTSAFETSQAPYRGLARVLLADGDVAGAFATIERTRARYLRDLRRHLAVRRHLGSADLRTADSLSERLSDIRLASLGAPDAGARAELSRESAEIQEALATLTPEATADDVALDLGAIRRALGERTLLSYTIDESGSAAFVVRADTLLAVPLAATTATVRALLRQAGAPWRGGAADPAFALAPLHELYRLLVAPVRSHVVGNVVTIVPDVEIAALPFALLPTAPAEDYATAPYLVREWTIGTELAASLVAEAPPPSTAGAVLAFGKGTFDGFTWNDAALLALPHVDAEVAAVGRYGRAIDDATEAAFDSLAATARIVHLASHAEAAPGLPLYSRVALGGGGGEDGTLHLYEILETPLAADLVVLSGCETGAGTARSGEGVIGLEYGVRAAGAAAAIATRWAVADGATTEIMRAFYAGLADGLPKDAALRAAQLAYLDSHEGLAASPFYWAAPVLSGSPAPLPLNDTRGRWVGALLLGIAATGGLAWWLIRPRADA